MTKPCSSSATCLALPFFCLQVSKEPNLENSISVYLYGIYAVQFVRVKGVRAVKKESLLVLPVALEFVG